MIQPAIQAAGCALTVQGISAGYPDARNAIRHVSFEVRRGERVGVLGPNGAGKSTLFKAIAGLIPHTSGEISIYGQDCRSSHHLVGYVPQYENVDLRFPVTVRDVVMMGRLRQIGWLRLPGSRQWRIVDELLERVGMQDFRTRQIGQLSGGQRRRVFIARALAQETHVLLLDEPFNGVDVTAQREIMEILDRLRGEGVTMLVATHDFSLATHYFDKLLLLNQRVVAYGLPADVFTPVMLKEAYGGGIGIFQHNGQQMLLLADSHEFEPSDPDETHSHQEPE